MLYIKTGGTFHAATKEDVLAQAATIQLDEVGPEDRLDCPEKGEAYLRAAVAGQEVETMAALWLTNDHRPIALDVLATGTLQSVQLPNRTLVKRALDRNARYVLLAHNHPGSESEEPRPSMPDIQVTVQTGEFLASIEVTLLEHFVFNKRGSVRITECQEFREIMERKHKEHARAQLQNRLAALGPLGALLADGLIHGKGDLN